MSVIISLASDLSKPQDPVGSKIALGLGLKQSISRWRTVRRSIVAALQMKQTTLKIGR